MIVATFAATSFAAAFLMFWIQPLAAKALLPLLGGSPTVWVVSLAFFQTGLLAGYAYAHLTARWLRPRRQAILHLILMAGACVSLPIGFRTAVFNPGDDPKLWLLTTLTRIVGPAFFVIAATAPMVQRWFSLSNDKRAGDPYFLYAASNAGSFVALLSFPFLLEPSLRLTQQEMGWTIGFALLVALMILCAGFTGRRRHAPDISPVIADSTISWRDRFRWLALAAIPSSLLLGVTTFISTDIAAVPLLWVVPLALYLLTFVVAFSRHPIVSPRGAWAQAILVISVGAIGLWGLDVPWEALIGLHLAAFTATALACHGGLASSRPAPARLTEFYFWIALGGALGGWFNALLSPFVFSTPAEYPLALVLACLLRPGMWPNRRKWEASVLDVALPVLLFLLIADPAGWYVNWLDAESNWIRGAAVAIIIVVVCLTLRRPLRLALCVGMLLAATIVVPDIKSALHLERNFFGVLRVTDETLSNWGSRFHILYNGSTMHGAQSLESARRLQPITYYHPTGPLGHLFAKIGGTDRTHNVAVVGLGTGSIACYGHEGEDWTYFEINPAVERIARNRRWFTLLDDCPPHAKVLTGDARLLLKAQPEGRYNLIILDAFTSDAIPIHLLTREAIALYADKLAPGGFIVFHISNRYLNLGPVIAKTAETLGLVSVLGADNDETTAAPGDQKWASDWMIVARRDEDFAILKDDPLWKPVIPGRRAWTDDYSNILTVLNW